MLTNLLYILEDLVFILDEKNIPIFINIHQIFKIEWK